MDQREPINIEDVDESIQTLARAVISPELEELVRASRAVYFLCTQELYQDPDDEIIREFWEALRPFDAVWV